MPSRSAIPTALKRAPLAMLIVALCSCVVARSGNAPVDAGAVGDGPRRLDLALDLSRVDLGPSPDLGVGLDLSLGDLGPQDLGPPDLGPRDLGPPDLGPPDLGPPDLGPPDLGPPDLGPPPCGNGVVSGAETCDDGSTQAGDGCSPSCRVETPFVCTGSPSVCSYTVSYAGSPVPTMLDTTVSATVTATPVCRIRTLRTSHAWNPDHTSVGDLIINLVGPTGATTQLSNVPSADTRDVRGPYEFASTGAVWPPSGNPLPAGTYAASFVAFFGTLSNGPWRLYVRDVAPVGPTRLMIRSPTEV